MQGKSEQADRGRSLNCVSFQFLGQLPIQTSFKKYL